MNRIIDPDKLRIRLGLEDDPGILESIESALDGALVRAESLLGTAFAKETRSDVFFLDTDVHAPINRLYSLRLTNGFVRSDTPVTVVSGGTLTDIAQEGEPIPYLVSPITGFVKLEQGQGGRYVKVTYGSGFGDTDQPPPWLKELVLGLTAEILSFQQVSDGKPEMSEAFKYLQRHHGEIATKHLRLDSSAIFPLV